MSTLIRPFGRPPVLSTLSLAVLGAALLHLLVILAIGFEFPEPSAPKSATSLDIRLIQPTPERDTPPPEQADFLAQQDHQGGAEELAEQRPTTRTQRPASVPEDRPTPNPATTTTVRPALPRPRPVITTTAAAKPAPAPRPAPPERLADAPSLAQLLASTQVEIDRLTAELDLHAQNSAGRERRKAINASTREYRYAAYLDAWRKKVERIGNLNYPQEARRLGLHGNLVLHVAVRADGSLERVRLVKSSGSSVLDDAAIRIVRLAAPYAPFPADIRAQVDVLDITRTWQFLDDDRLFAR